MPEEKIWGTTEKVIVTRTTTVHILRVKKGGVCSWHYHDNKYNHFHLISGSFLIRMEGHILVLDRPGMSCTIGPGRKSLHEFEAQEDSVVIETCYVNEGEINSNDIHRLRLGYYNSPSGTVFYAPDDGTIEK